MKKLIIIALTLFSTGLMAQKYVYDIGFHYTRAENASGTGVEVGRTAYEPQIGPDIHFAADVLVPDRLSRKAAEAQITAVVGWQVLKIKHIFYISTDFMVASATGHIFFIGMGIKPTVEVKALSFSVEPMFMSIGRSQIQLTARLIFPEDK